MSNIEFAFTAVIGTFTILGILELRVGRMVKRLVSDYLSESKRLDDLFTILVKKTDKE